MKIRVMPLRQSSISLITKNDMVSIVDWHVVKSTISCNCYWIRLYINRSRRDLPRLKAWVDNTLEDLCYYSFYQIPSAWAPGLLTCNCGRTFWLNCRYLKPYMYINNLKLSLSIFFCFFSLKLHYHTNIDTVSAKSQREFVQWT